MYQNKGEPSVGWGWLWRTPARALLLGVSAAAAAGLFGLVCGALLCLAGGAPWVAAAWWGLRGACAGLVAGTLTGAISGIYHVEERAPVPAPAESRQPRVPNGAFLPARPVVAFYRKGVRSKN